MGPVKRPQLLFWPNSCHLSLLVLGSYLIMFWFYPSGKG